MAYLIHASARIDAPRDRSGMTPFIRRLQRNGMALAALSVLTLIAGLAAFAPLVATGDPGAMDSAAFVSPSLQHLMGTDDLGRDVFTRFIFGGRVSLTVGGLAAITACFVGILVGAVAGFAGGLADTVLMRLSELFQVIPRFFLALLVMALFGTHFIFLVLTIGLLSWPEVARITRAEVLSLREREYVAAARAIGLPRPVIIFGEILPNAMPSLIVAMTMQVSAAILLEASLSFLGMGDPSNPSWGLMLNEAQQFLGRGWWMALFPGLGILFTVAALNVLGDRLADILNPRLRGGS